jgi:hypothetical protein
MCFVWLGWQKESTDPNRATRSLMALLLFPTALFWMASYSESLFMLLAISCWWAATRQRWTWAGMLALLAASTRLVGVFLVPALLVEYLYQNRTTLRQKGLRFFTIKTHIWSILKISVGAIGLLGYMAYLAGEFGDPLYFLHVQSEFGAGRQESLILYPQVLWRSIKILLTFPLQNIRYFSYFQEFLAGTLPLLLLAKHWKKVNPGLLVFSLACFFLPTTTGTFSSMPRYIMVMIPIYPLLAEQFSGKKWWFWLTLSSIWLMINTVLFIQGYWVA